MDSLFRQFCNGDYLLRWFMGLLVHMGIFCIDKKRESFLYINRRYLDVSLYFARERNKK